MKKVICIILGLIVVLGAWPLYGVVHNEESFNYGEYLYEETAVVKDIDLNNEKITVSIENSDTYWRADSDPYEDKDVCLDCSKVKEAVLEQLEISNEIVFTHIYVKPYIVAEIKQTCRTLYKCGRSFVVRFIIVITNAYVPYRKYITYQSETSSVLFRTI